MLRRLGDYVYERRQGLLRTGGVVAGVYLAGSYVAESVSELRDRMVQERNARENLRRRFEQNQQDASYMIMGLMPTLASQILDGMDVETLTAELQSKAKAKPPKAAPSDPAPLPIEIQMPTAPSTEPDHSTRTASDQELSGSQAPSRSTSLTMSMSSFSIPDRPDEPGPGSLTGSSFLDASLGQSSMGDTGRSWITEFTGSANPDSRHSPTSASSAAGSSGRASQAQSLPDSLSTSAVSSAIGDANEHPPSTNTRTKAELWKEIKMLTFTRTLTVLYASTLLALFTHVQLTQLARRRYIASVIRSEREERRREQERHLLKPGIGLALHLWFGGDIGLPWMSGGALALAEEEETRDVDGSVDGETERMFLTLSWWILHVGWKDVGERARRAVEEVFAPVSLKTQMTAMELHRLVHDVRRRVEHEVTFEGTERRINFLSTLLPPTTEMLHHVLTKGGIRVAPPAPLGLPPRELTVSASESSLSSLPSMSASLLPPTSLSDLTPDPPLYPAPQLHTDLEPAFDDLLSETKRVLAGPDFARVLELCLDRATEVLFTGLERSIFRDVNLPVDLGDKSTQIAEDEAIQVRLAGMLPGLARWSNLALTSLPNELVDQVSNVAEVTTLSAIIFGEFGGRFS
ncbi:hypothetical protein PUNSTDRAFT_140873 [Punctularia strigosozonata HHB-11173 SS5]|uniref:uncharacterized protein n=1 Tax=Punctularia strigosozonata (strain HHB-11173) TaxID=741275 RepID=UPI0004416A85|nr:uncharacterized protein PUNSTDRAFT_140873 [Punctularia strigosozonata HHB-11173 SS5]EIN14632.1 hypothetical protein PUNSTDRAFT_140873 [Punctularia strigosozonata HHB-11173 SS5]